MKAKGPSLLRAIAITTAFALLTLAQTPTETYEGQPAEANEVLIKFESASAADAQARANIQADIKQAEADASIDTAQTVGSSGWMLFHSPTNDVPTRMSILTGGPGVARLEPNWIYHTPSIPNDTYVSDEWGMYNTGQTIGGQTGSAGFSDLQ
jgi:hypothetical protein